MFKVLSYMQVLSPANLVPNFEFAQTIFGWPTRVPSPQSVPAIMFSRPTSPAYLTRRCAISSGCSMKSLTCPNQSAPKAQSVPRLAPVDSAYRLR